MKHKIFRISIALVLVVVLVVSWSPARVQASALPEAAAVVTKVIPFNPASGAAAGAALGTQVFGWVLLGLGLIVTTAQVVELMNAYTEYSGELETSIYYYPDGTWSYGVDMSFVERVRAFLWDDGYLQEVVNSPDGSVYTSLTCEFIESAAMASYAVLVDSGSSQPILFWSNFPLIEVYSSDGTRCFWASGETFNWFCHAASISAFSTTALKPAGSGSLIWFGRLNKVAGTTEDFSLAYCPLPSLGLDEGYSEWYTNAQPATNPDTEDEITVLPIPIVPDYDTESLPDGVTQEDVWPGSIADPLPDTDTGTDTDPGTGSDDSLASTPWETFKKWISEGWQSIIQAIPTVDSIAQAIGNVIKSIFVPDEDFLTEKWEAIRSEFKFADSIMSSGELILDVLNDIAPEPPVIYIDLGASEGSYDLGGEVAFLDLRWYARYKPTADAIISAFLWLVFAWRMFVKLPGIISGMPGDFVMQGVVDLGLSERLPSRKKEYEYERQQNRRSMRK